MTARHKRPHRIQRKQRLDRQKKPLGFIHRTRGLTEMKPQRASEDFECAVPEPARRRRVRQQSVRHSLSLLLCGQAARGVTTRRDDRTRHQAAVIGHLTGGAGWRVVQPSGARQQRGTEARLAKLERPADRRTEMVTGQADELLNRRDAARWGRQHLTGSAERGRQGGQQDHSGRPAERSAVTQVSVTVADLVLALVLL